LSAKPQIGDIVEVLGDAGTRWVFAGRSGSPWGAVPYADLLRPNWSTDGLRSTQRTVYETGLVLIESPTFIVGQRVCINGFQGTIIAFAPPQIEGEKRVQIAIDNYRTPLAGGGHLLWCDSLMNVPTASLVLENLMQASRCGPRFVEDSGE
jgi:hypothetical protein